MGRFVKFTRFVRLISRYKDSEGRTTPFWINAESIIAIVPVTPSGSNVFTGNDEDDYWAVFESPEEVLTLIEQADTAE